MASCCSLDDKAMNLGSLKLARKGAQPTDAVANLLDIAGIIRRSGERFRALARKKRGKECKGLFFRGTGSGL